VLTDKNYFILQFGREMEVQFPENGGTGSKA
jgi:hypothetical protein